ncbi:MAG: murein biosynthesis integral membrane protein MurJ [Bdellovibrionales bacterium]
MQTSSAKVLKSAMKMAAGTMSSRVLGLIRDILVASSFSLGMTDAWFVAYRIPNMFRRLFGEGALSYAFIPVLSELRENRGLDEAKELSFQLFNILFLVLSGLSLSCIFFAEPIIHFFAGGESFLNVPGKLENTIRFLKIMAFFLLFICMFAYFMAVLNANKKFFAAAFAPVLLNICLIVACLLPVSLVSVHGDLLSYGALLGGFLQMAILIPAVKKIGFFPKFKFKVSKSLLRVLRNSIPAILSMGVLQLTTMVNVYYASRLQEGANSWIYYADRLLELPLSLIAVSFGTALLPSLSEAWVKKESGEFRSLFSSQILNVWFLAIPSAFGLFFFAEPIISLVFERGKFDSTSVVETAGLLRVYAFSLIIFASTRLFNTSFYAIQKVWVPILVSSIALISHLIMIRYWLENFGLQGLAMSSASAGLIALVVVLGLFIKTHQIKLDLSVIVNILGFILLSVMMIIIGRFVVFDSLSGNWNQNLVTLISILSCIVVYFGLAIVLRLDQMKNLKRRRL